MARSRGKQRGHLRQEGPSWIGYWQESDEQGVWRQRSRKVSPLVDSRGRPVTKKQAQRLFDGEILEDLDTLNLYPKAAGTLAQFWKEKFEPTLIGKKPKTQDHYRTTWNTHIGPFIGHLKMRDVDLDVVQQLISQEASRPHPGKKKGSIEIGYSPQTLYHVKNMLSTMFKRAKKLQWYSGDLPIEGVELPALTRVKERHALTADQIKTLLDALAGKPKPLIEFVSFLVITGLRVGEASGLKWKNVNLESEWKIVDGLAIPPTTMAIRSNWVKGKYQTVKRDASARMVPIEGALADLLRDWKAETKFAGPEDPVFPSSTGRPLDHHNVANRTLRPLGKQLQMPWLSWHSFRHTANTVAGIVGMSVTQRKKVFGWSEDRMALHYDHAGVEEMRSGMGKIGEFLIKRKVQ
jgi:integrase